jgi:hypothetical protein
MREFLINIGAALITPFVIAAFAPPALAGDAYKQDLFKAESVVFKNKEFKIDGDLEDEICRNAIPTAANSRLVRTGKYRFFLLTKISFGKDGNAAPSCFGYLQINALLKHDSTFIIYDEAVVKSYGYGYGSPPDYRVELKFHKPPRISVRGGAFNQGGASTTSETYVLLTSGAKLLERRMSCRDPNGHVTSRTSTC